MLAPAHAAHGCSVVAAYRSAVCTMMYEYAACQIHTQPTTRANGGPLWANLPRTTSGLLCLFVPSSQSHMLWTYHSCELAYCAQSISRQPGGLFIRIKRHWPSRATVQRTPRP